MTDYVDLDPPLYPERPWHRVGETGNRAQRERYLERLVVGIA